MICPRALVRRSRFALVRVGSILLLAPTRCVFVRLRGCSPFHSDATFQNPHPPQLCACSNLNRCTGISLDRDRGSRRRALNPIERCRRTITIVRCSHTIGANVDATAVDFAFTFGCETAHAQIDFSEPRATRIFASSRMHVRQDVRTCSIVQSPSQDRRNLQQCRALNLASSEAWQQGGQHHARSARPNSAKATSSSTKAQELVAVAVLLVCAVFGRKASISTAPTCTSTAANA